MSKELISALQLVSDNVKAQCDAITEQMTRIAEEDEFNEIVSDIYINLIETVQMYGAIQESIAEKIVSFKEKGVFD